MRQVLLIALLTLAGCDQAPFAKQPPAKYQNSGVYLVKTSPTATMATVCAGASTVGENVVPGGIVACFRGVAVQAPNPCEWHGQSYAELMCHEFGHAQGWPGNHPDS